MDRGYSGWFSELRWWSLLEFKRSESGASAGTERLRQQRPLLGRKLPSNAVEVLRGSVVYGASNAITS